MRLHRVLHRVLGPVLRIRGGQEVGDLLPVDVPRLLGGLLAGRVTGLRRQHQRDRAGDVLVQQGGELVAGGLPEVRHDRRSDIVLVGLEAAKRRPGVRQGLAIGAADRADDREPGPGHVVFPELAHLVVERGLLRRLGEER